MFAFVAYFSRASDRHWFLSVINDSRLFSDGYGTVGIGTFNSLQIGSHPSFGLKIINFSAENKNKLFYLPQKFTPDSPEIHPKLCKDRVTKIYELIFCPR